MIRSRLAVGEHGSLMAPGGYQADCERLRVGKESVTFDQGQGNWMRMR